MLEGQQEWQAKGGAQAASEPEVAGKASEAELAEQVAAAARALRIEAEEEGTEEDLRLFEQAIRGEFRAENAKEDSMDAPAQAEPPATESPDAGGAETQAAGTGPEEKPASPGSPASPASPGKPGSPGTPGPSSEK